MAGESTGPKCKATTFLLNEHNTNLPFKYVSQYPWISAAFIIETAFGRQWQLLKTTDQSVCEVYISIKRIYISYPLLRKMQTNIQRKRWKHFKSIKSERTDCHLDMTGPMHLCKHEIIAAVVGCTKSSQS